MPVMSLRLNNRDHRKLLIVDGVVGFTGGIHLADQIRSRDIDIVFGLCDHVQIDCLAYCLPVEGGISVGLDVSCPASGIFGKILRPPCRFPSPALCGSSST